jgi:hypothetical protein
MFHTPPAPKVNTRMPGEHDRLGTPFCHPERIRSAALAAEQPLEAVL